MKLAIFSDVHANLEALEAVLGDMSARGVTRRFCLGDLVGYGPNPVEVCARIRQLGIETLQGNHDEEVSRDHYPYRCNAVAATSILWTRSIVSGKDRRWLGSLPQKRVLPGMHLTLSHANVHAPETWEYITNLHEAQWTLMRQPTPLGFIGHTHEPAVYVLTATGVVQALALEEFTLQPGCR
ncbi:MAG TPA: metallophosphoesterase family protein, partial [Bacillota bacterium]|nr:metallophosphoesterase family protein [Bacillota bacterium]